MEEASDAHQSVPSRHPWPRHRPRRFRHLPCRRASLQQDQFSLFFSPPPCRCIVRHPLTATGDFPNSSLPFPFHYFLPLAVRWIFFFVFESYILISLCLCVFIENFFTLSSEENEGVLLFLHLSRSSLPIISRDSVEICASS